MAAKLDELRNALIEWGKRKDMFDETIFYTRERAIELNLEHCKDSELTIILDGSPLYDLLQYELDSPDQKEFDKIVESFGFMYEFGDHWYICFYPL